MLRTFVAFIFILVSLTAKARDASPKWEMTYREIEGNYAIYGGELGDPVAPQNQDKNIVFSLIGEVAQEMFDAIGPDIKYACTEGNGIRVRSKDKGKLSCILYPDDGYICRFGFGLNTG